MKRFAHPFALASALIPVLSLGGARAALAEDSPPVSDEQAAALAATKAPTEAQEAFFAYLLEAQRRYTESGGIPVEQLLTEEGETAAQLYCRAIGIDGPCAPVDDGERTRYVAVSATERRRWWQWIGEHTINIGVIPELNFCPSPFSMVEIYMDDEDNNNINGRSGWIGATVSTANTRWRFCKLNVPWTIQFFPISPMVAPPPANFYAVQSFGIVCPIGSRWVLRYQDNEDSNNANSFSGGIFPNFVSNAGSWMITCHYDSGAPSLWPTMATFPTLPMHYGMYGSPIMPPSLAILRGRVYQDDEDIVNLNFWVGSPAGTMQGGGNTERFLIKAY
ncbi:MAG: hypothetical protein E6Q88_04885 [Lysobacteraceae bacterium]|nr:MAG: hypothetical protein E6Q88_04885 [Xanthomonadaceae bacterium]